MRTQDTGYGADYWQSLDNGAGYRDGPLWEDLAHIIAEVFTQSRPLWRVLDVGCAAGFLSHHLRRRGYESFGLDISEYALGLAPAEVAPYLHRYDLTEPNSLIKQPGAPADLVVCLETLEHIPEESVGVALANLRQGIAPGGLAFLSICLNDVPGWSEDPTHVTIHDRSWWLRALHLAGFAQHDPAVGQLRRFRMWQRHNGLFVITPCG